MKEFMVKAKCGHVGRNSYIIKEFPVVAHNGKEAAKLVRYAPRVLHDVKDAIIDVINISHEEYIELSTKFKNDKYFDCRSKQDQNELCPEIDFQTLKRDNEKVYNKEKRKERVSLKFKKYEMFYQVKNTKFCY